MLNVENKEHLIWLKDFYAPLLTSRQQEVLNLYLDGDYTLTEIAESFGSTRQAVYDMVKRTEKTLVGYEKKLGLLKRFHTARQQAEKIECLIQKFPGNDDEKNEIIQALDEMLAML